MKTVRITEAFMGYPNGTDEKAFAKGEEPTVSNAFAALIVGKGLAEEIGDVADETPAEAPQQEHDA